MRKYAVTIEGGWLAIVEATRPRDAEAAARRDWAEGSNLRSSEIETTARLATDDDIAWHRAMGGHG